jgi:hypothetical protein
LFLLETLAALKAWDFVKPKSHGDSLLVSQVCAFAPATSTALDKEWLVFHVVSPMKTTTILSNALFGNRASSAAIKDLANA